jgi:hypothetical protein
MEINNNDFYRAKYILYKNKYLKLKIQLGGAHVNLDQLQFTIDNIGSNMTDIMITDKLFNNPNVSFGHSGNHVAFVTIRENKPTMCRFNLEPLNDMGHQFIETYVNENTDFFIEQATQYVQSNK